MEATTEDTQKESADKAATSSANTPAVPAAEVKKGKKDDRTKKDDKNLEQFMRSLNSIPTLEEKLSLVCKKYVQVMEDNKKMQFYIKQSEKRFGLILKEKEQLQLEFNKTVLIKSKIENLCRELQKQNKAIKEESLLKIREEEERRKETQAKFQNTLSEITAMLQQNNEKNAKLRDDNISMTEKFKSVVTQYQLREQQVDKMSKQMELESQLSEAKMQKASLEHQADKEKLLSEMEQLKVTVATYRAKIMELQGTETSLRTQLSIYTEKYDDFQNALGKSSQMFAKFKVQMETMSKKIKKLEKESLSWKTKWETSQKALLDMCAERQSSEEKAAATSRQLMHMQGLCRTLQAERAALLGALKAHDIERPPLPPPAPAGPSPPAPGGAKVDAMAADCVQLRQSLAHLQNQLNVLTNKQKEESPKPEAKPEKQEKKKSKSKKNKSEKKIENRPKEEPENVDLTDENKSIANENTSDSAEQVDDATIENLLQAINNANLNLCDLEVVSDEIVEATEGVKIIEINDNEQKHEELTSTDVISSDLSDTKDKETNSTEIMPKDNTGSGVTDIDDTPKSAEIKLEELNFDKDDIDQNVSIVESTNDEVSHINEVKPLSNRD